MFESNQLRLRIFNAILSISIIVIIEFGVYVFYSNFMVYKWHLIHDLSVHLTGEGPTLANQITGILAIFAMFVTGHIFTACIGINIIHYYEV